MRGSISIIARGVCSLILIGLLLYRTDLHGIAESLSDIRTGWFVLAASLHISGVFLTAWRWWILLKARELNVPIVYLARSFLIASFLNFFFPTSVGGDVFRAYDTAKYTGEPEKALGILLVERLSGLFSLVLLAVLASPWVAALYGSAGLATTPVVIAIIFIVVSLLLFWKPFIAGIGRIFDLPVLRKVKRKARDVHEAMTSFRFHKIAFGYAFFVGLLLQLNFVLHHYFIARAVGMPVAFPVFLFLVPLVSVLLLVPASLNGIGLRENAFVVLLSVLGVPREQSIAFCALLFGAMVLFGIIGGIVYAVGGGVRRSEYPEDIHH
jgi:uncharacterized protein (TIRG00374 family)